MRIWIAMVMGLLGCIEGSSDRRGDDGGGGGGGGGGGCSEAADTCGGETICVGTSCVAAFPRVYEVRDVQVSVATTDPIGEGWDAGGGAPDLKLAISVNGTQVASAPAVDDTFSASFAGPFAAQLIAGSTLVVEVLDEDLTVDDPAYGCQAAPITAGLLRARTVRCATGNNTLSFEIDPR